VPGIPQEDWPWFYIDPDTCIDCGACIPECPFHAIYPEDDVPQPYLAMGGEIQTAPKGTPGFDEPFDGYDYQGNAVHIENTRVLKPDQEVDLTEDIKPNYDYFSDGPGYSALM
jgi:ferredoxin